MKEIRERTNSILARLALDDLLTRFSRPDGIGAVGDFASHPVERWLLFDAASPLHASEGRTKLKTTLAEGPEAAVAKNCFAYLSMLADPNRVGFDATTLSRDPELVVQLWEAASRMRVPPGGGSAIRDLAARLSTGLPDGVELRLPPDDAEPAAANSGGEDGGS
jgi:hypothetical protein